MASLLGALAVAIVAVGFRLFSSPTTSEPEAPAPPERRVFSVRGDLLDLMVAVPPGPALTWPDPDDPSGPDRTVVVPWYSRILAYEVTRGMWAEFVAAGEADPGKVPAFLRALWRPEPACGGLDLDGKWARLFRTVQDGARLLYANEFVNRWWEVASKALARAAGHPVTRPGDFVAPLPAHYGALLLVPPSWVYQTPFEELRWALPEGTENLPVTEVSWFDAVAFAEWASHELGGPDPAPPVRGVDPGRQRRRAGESLPLGGGGLPVRLQQPELLGRRGRSSPPAVSWTFSEEPGRTREGLWGMSGNAREWAHNCEFERVEDHLQPAVPANLEAGRGRAPTLGGSFREGIQDCTVDVDSVEDLDKQGRWDHVGFRLWMPGNWMGR